MFVDLDKFKAVNDLFGHDMGDEVLRRVSIRISACLRSRDTLSRLGGDEFVAILCDIESRSEVDAVVERINEMRAIPLEIDRQQMATGWSIGIAFFPDDGEDLETLLKKADTAMYSVKAGGCHKYRFAKNTGDLCTGLVPLNRPGRFHLCNSFSRQAMDCGVPRAPAKRKEPLSA